MNYSTTYLAQWAQFIGLALTLANIHIDPNSLETTLSVIATVLSGLMVLYRRYQAGGVSVMGIRE